MKKFTMFSSVLASALMLVVASCSSEDVAGVDAQNGKGTTSFLAVNIENVGSAPASRSYNSSYNKGDGTYEDGTEAESKINNVRFYFLMEMELHICCLIMIQRSNLLTIWNTQL